MLFENIISLQLSSVKNYAAIIDSIACAGQADGKSRISLVLSRFNLFIFLGLNGFWMHQYPV